MSRIRQERGASAVEFAIIASLLFMVLFGTIQFGIIFNRYQGLQASAREAARLGSLQATSRSDIVQRVSDSLSIIAAADNVDPCPGGGSTPSFASAGDWCVKVLRRATPGGALTTHTTDNPGPCNAQFSDQSKSVVVQVWYRARIDIPLWASPQMTISGTGEFRCE